jgi:hypothetical protein
MGEILGAHLMLTRHVLHAMPCPPAYQGKFLDNLSKEGEPASRNDLQGSLLDGPFLEQENQSAEKV